MKYFPFFIFQILMVGISYCQIVPVDNPYLTKYGNDPFQYHWTDSISWSNVLKAKSVNGLFQTTTSSDSFVVNQTTLNSILDSLSTRGGVLFFPAGKFYFSDNLYLRSNVVIRGVASIIPDAKVEGFAPLTKFIFPRYISGTARSTAFKEITADTFGISKSGLVDVDINRAVISLYGGGYTTNLCGKTYANPQAMYLSEKIILMGLRQNNAATPDPRMPNASQMSFGASATSQVWPGINGSNMNINVAKQCVISNCRINDENGSGDNFLQPSYILQTNIPIPNVAYTTFNFKHQNGISLNYNKLTINGKGVLSGPHGKHGIYSSKRYANPDEEPLFFGTELEIKDNWVKTLAGAKIMASGLNLLVHNNVLSDDTVDKTYYLNRSGIRAEVNGGATFGNAGILFSGWGVKISDNTIISTSGLMLATSGFKSVDGESILYDGSVFSTSVNGVLIENNKINTKTNRGVLIFAPDNLNKISIKKNDLGNKEVYIGGGSCSGSPCPMLNGLQIDSNYNVNSIFSTGNFSGTQCQNYISRNQFLPGVTSGISMSDLIEIKSNNILNGKTINSVASVTGGPGKVHGKLEGPSSDTSVYVCPNQSGVYVKFVVNIDCNYADSVVLYHHTQCGLQRVSSAETGDGFHFTYNYPINPANGTATENFVAKAYSGGYIYTDWTNMRTIKKICVNNVADKVQNQELTLIPNPTESNTQIRGISHGDVVTVFNTIGQLVYEPKKMNTDDAFIDVRSLKSGIYFVKIVGKGSIKLVKK